MTQFPEMDDPELRQLMELEAAERGEAEFVATHTGGSDLDPDLAELMAIEQAERTGQPAPPPDTKGRRWGRRR
jgi:hypothetical protein